MKSVFRSFLIGSLMVAGLWACKKETDQILSPDQLITGSYIRIDSTISNEFNFSSIATSSVAWDVRGVGEAISKITVYASATNSSDSSTWRRIKDIQVSDNKARVSVTGQELATALNVAPTALSPGNQYTLFTEVTTTSGRRYSLVNTNSELESAAAYNMAFRLPGTVTCPFDPTGFAGNFRVVTDDWADFSAGDILQVTGATANSVTLLAFPSPAYGTNRQPITISVNPANGRATINPSQYIGDYTFAGVVPSRISTATNRNSYVFSCTGDIILYHVISYGGSNQPVYLLRLKKV